MSAASRIRRRLAGDFEVDEWGLDSDLVETLSPLFSLRWSIEVQGAERLDDGPALLVYNRRFGPSEPFVVARAIRSATGRHLRVAGVPDVMIAGPILRRLGAVLDRPDEIGSVLRAGHLVGVALGRTFDLRPRAGAVDLDPIAEARRLGVPIHPVALRGSEPRRRWLVTIGAAVESDSGDGPVGDAELARTVREQVDDLITAASRS